MVYYLARQLLKSGRLAFAAAFMMCWDFMHFAQTRIATIDVFAVFFILCMYYCMARYLAMSHPEADRKRRALWLGACGLAPVMMINDEVYGRLTEAEIPGILAKYKAS